MRALLNSLDHWRYTLDRARARCSSYESLFGPDSNLVRNNKADIYKIQRLVNILEIRLNRYVSQEKEY